MTDRHEERFMADAAKLATEIAPERDLWPDIEAEITRPARRTGVPWFAQAAAVVALVGASSFITWMMTKTEAPVGPTVPVMVHTDSFDAEFASFGRELMLPASFEAERSGLASELDIALDQLSPEVRAEVEENLAVIQNAVDEISAALESEPNNVLLQEMLADAYRKELSVMRHVGGLARNATARNDI